MAFNVQTFTEKLSKELDKRHVQDMVTGFLAGGSLEAEFSTADTVLVPEFDMSGLGTYEREQGFPKGGIAMRKRSYTLPMERGRQFQVDVRDLKTNDVKDALGTLASMMKIFQKQKVDQEVDAYNLSTIGAFAKGNHRTTDTFTADSTDATKRLIFDIDKAAEMADGEELFAFLNWDIHGFLSANTEFNKYIDVANFKKGEIDTQLKVLNGAGIVKTPSKRMATAYEFFNGVDAGQKTGGFAAVAGAGSYNWIILPRSAAECITVLEKTQLITPENNNDAYAYKQGYRRLFGAIVKASNEERIVASVNE